MMDKLQHLRKTKTYLRKIAGYRRIAMRQSGRKQNELPLQLALHEIDYQVNNLKSFDQMMAYISKQSTRSTVKLIITDKKQEEWLPEFDHLVHLGNVLDGKIIRDKQPQLF